MRTLLLVLLFCSTFTFSNAQETIKNEVGFSFSGFNSFGLSAKFQSEANKFWRLGIFANTGSFAKSELDDDQLTRNNVGLNAGFGREIRKPIIDNFYFLYGVDASVGFTYSKNRTSDAATSDFEQSLDRQVRIGIAIPLGFNYILKDAASFSLEFAPGIGYRYSNLANSNSNTNKVANLKTNDFFYNVSTNALRLTVAYRFQKKKNRG